MLNINLLGNEEQGLRISALQKLMTAAGIEHALLRDNANIYYLTGRVFRGFIYIDTTMELPLYFVRQPNHLECDRPGALFKIRKPEEIPALIAASGTRVDHRQRRLLARNPLSGGHEGSRVENPLSGGVPALELDADSYSEAVRLAAAFGGVPQQNISPVLRAARSVKTAVEQEKLRQSGEHQTLVYERIPHYFREGMTDIEFQIEIERASRLEGCLGQFRVSGSDMELFMGNVLVGENADTPSPYDFAMGGQGIDPSIPVGANGTIIKPGMPVMVDVNGNYTGYMTDMTRMYISGAIPEKAQQALDLSIAICDELSAMMHPGAKAADLYARALQMAIDAGMAEFFMGHRSHAGFVGHGIGIEVNELPVIAPRSRDILQDGNVIALEPKFVIPGIGAVGIENTYIVHADAPAEVITKAKTQFISLD